MFCKHCGAENNYGVKFCTSCGKNVEDAPAVQVVELPKEPVKKKPACFGVFAKVGFGFGLAGIILTWLYGVGGFFGLVGLIFSILGLMSYENKGRATAGLVMSIISVAFAVVVICIIAFWGSLFCGFLGSIANM